MDELTITFEDKRTVALPYATSQISPPTGLAVAPVVGGGTFAAGNYFWEVTATTALGETTVSNEATTAIALNGSANLTWVLPNGKVSNIKVYRGTVSGAENVLVTTLAGNVIAFTDTNVGGAGAPPGANTATIQDTVLLTGAGQYMGFAFSETSGANPAFVEIQDSGVNLGECRLAASGSETEVMKDLGIELFGRVNIHVNTGSVRGLVWVAIPC